MRVRPVAVVGLVCLVVLGGCTGGQLRLARLRTVPGVRSAYPGSVELRRLETEASANAMAKDPALIEVDACAPAAQDRVLAWFTERLRRTGWSQDAGHLTTSDTGEYEPQSTTWSRGERHFELRFLTAAYADHLAGGAGVPGGCVTAYESIVQ